MKQITAFIFSLFFGIALTTQAQTKFVGGDISLLPSYETNGAIYRDMDGNTISGGMLPYFKEQGMNAMRVRLFVDPTKASTSEKGEGVRQDLEYVKALGKQIKDAGMALMLDFHYSDSWADPVKQWKPDSWKSLTDDQLYTQIYDYTKDVLQQMNAAGATPDFIQTGNEISYGMLWGVKSDAASTLKKCYYNSDDNWPYFTTLLKNAIQACHEECPDAKIVIHTERVAKPTILYGFYDKIQSYGVDYDIIGLSYYPYYHGTLQGLNTVLTQLESRYADKEIMIVETGYYHNWQPEGVDYDLSATYPISGEGQKAFTEALIAKLSDHSHVTGLFWWFMEANEYGLDWNTKRVTDNWYNAGLFDNQTGKALPALYVLKDFLGEQAGITEMETENASSTIKGVYTLDGRQIGNTLPNQKSIYIIDGKKRVVR